MVKLFLVLSVFLINLTTDIVGALDLTSKGYQNEVASKKSVFKPVHEKSCETKVIEYNE